MDGAAVRLLARSVGEAAAGVREAAGRLATASAATWVSVAADEFRTRLVTERVRVEGAAHGLDDAAAALLRHAAAVDAHALDAQHAAAVLARVRTAVTG